MTRFKKTVAALGAFLALAGLWTQQASAASVVTNPANEDLLVTFTANLSVKIDGIQYSTRTLGALNAGQTFVPVSSATVTNDSAGLTEKFQLTSADVSTGAVAPLWTVAPATGSTGGGAFCAANVGDVSCPGADAYALQALFISSANAAGCPSNVTADWDLFKSTVAAAPTTYLSSYFADTSAGFGNQNGGTGNPDQTAGAQNGNMFAIGNPDGRGKRGLCVRLTMPASSASTGQHIVRLTITALTGS
jgi:hypothetical protein